MKQTNSMLFFLSRGYFFSANCKKEIKATLDNRNPIILLHEVDPNRGGMALEQVKADCPDDWRDGIFSGDRPVIQWHRIRDFKLESLKMIVSSMLLHQRAAHGGTRKRLLDSLQEDRDLARDNSQTLGRSSICSRFSLGSRRSSASQPDRADTKEPPRPDHVLGSELYVPGEVTQQHLRFLVKTTIIVSPENPGALEMLAEMTSRYPDLRLRPPATSYKQATSLRLPQFMNDVVDSLSEASVAPSFNARERQRRGGGDRSDDRKKVFLLYLNRETFVGETGNKLAAQVRAARRSNIPVILVHENDADLGGCTFSTFFQTTPHDLISGGLYARIAVAFQSGQHRKVSYCLLAKELGATRHRLREMLGGPKEETSSPQEKEAKARRSTAASQHSVTLVKIPLGLGCTLDGDFVVTEVSADSQAARAGIQCGDQIVSINGELPMAHGGVAPLLRGIPAGTSLKIELTSGEARQKSAAEAAREAYRRRSQGETPLASAGSPARTTSTISEAGARTEPEAPDCTSTAAPTRAPAAAELEAVVVEESPGAAISFPLTTSAYRRERGFSPKYSPCQVTLLAPAPDASAPWSAIESVVAKNGKRTSAAYEDVQTVRALDSMCEFIIQCAPVVPEQTFRVRMETRADFQTWQDAFGAKLVRSKQAPPGWTAARAAAAEAQAEPGIAAVARAAAAKAAAEAAAPSSSSGANAAEQQPPPQDTSSPLRGGIGSEEAAPDAGHPVRRSSSGNIIFPSPNGNMIRRSKTMNDAQRATPEAGHPIKRSSSGNTIHPSARGDMEIRRSLSCNAASLRAVRRTPSGNVQYEQRLERARASLAARAPAVHHGVFIFRIGVLLHAQSSEKKQDRWVRLRRLRRGHRATRCEYYM